MRTRTPKARPLASPSALLSSKDRPAQVPKDKSAPRPPTSLYFVNAPVDFLLIGGASIVTFILLRQFHSPQRTEDIWTAGTILLWVGNWPHFSATSYRLYHTRGNIMQYPVTALVIPWLIVAAVAGSLWSPTVIAPYFIKLLLIWSPYHFSGQTLGITLLYARRSGFKIGKWERLALSTFIYGTFITQTARFETNVAGSDFYGIRYPGMGLPEWTVTVATTAMWIGGAAFLFFAARWCLNNRRWLPPIVLLPAATQYVWFVHSAGIESYQEFVPFFHSVQYMLIAWSVQLKEKMDVRHIRPGLGYVLSESARWGILNFIGGACLFFMLPRLLAETGVQLAFATGVVFAAIQIHHFFVDGVIWKLKNKTVSSPLMVNLADLVSPRPALEGSAR
jgi:hypothetical protein